MEEHNGIKSPCVGNANAPQGFTHLAAEQVIDLLPDLTLKSIHSSDSFISFWVRPQFEFPLVSCKALRIFLPFA